MASAQTSWAAIESSSDEQASFILPFADPQGGSFFQKTWRPFAVYGFEHMVTQATGGAASAVAGATEVQFLYGQLLDYAWKTAIVAKLPAVVAIGQDASGNSVLLSGANAAYYVRKAGIALCPKTTLVCSKGAAILTHVTDDRAWNVHVLHTPAGQQLKDAILDYADVSKLQAAAASGCDVFHFAGLGHNWTGDPADAFPLSAVYVGGAGLQVNLRPLDGPNGLLQVPASAKALYSNIQYYVRPASAANPGYAATDDEIAAKSVSAPRLLQPTDLKVRMQSLCANVGQDERTALMFGATEMIYKEVLPIAPVTVSLANVDSDNTFTYNFNAGHVVEYAAVKLLPKAQADAGNYYDFFAPAQTINGRQVVREPIVNYSLVFGHTPNISTRPGVEGREVNPSIHCARVPGEGEYVYVIPQAVKLSTNAPVGGYDNATLGQQSIILKVDPNCLPATLLVEMAYPQIYRFRNGGPSRVWWRL